MIKYLFEGVLAFGIILLLIVFFWPKEKEKTERKYSSLDELNKVVEEKGKEWKDTLDDVGEAEDRLNEIKSKTKQ